MTIDPKKIEESIGDYFSNYVPVHANNYDNLWMCIDITPRTVPHDSDDMVIYPSVGCLYITGIAGRKIENIKKSDITIYDMLAILRYVERKYDELFHKRPIYYVVSPEFDDIIPHFTLSDLKQMADRMIITKTNISIFLRSMITKNIMLYNKSVNLDEHGNIYPLSRALLAITFLSC